MILAMRSSVRFNLKLFAALVGLSLIVLLAFVLSQVQRGAAQHEAERLAFAAEFLKTHAVLSDNSGSYFAPLPPALQAQFEEDFRDGRNIPFFYDPWQSDGSPIRQSSDNGDEIVAYSLNPTSDRFRCILTAGLSVHRVPDSEIEWRTRRWVAPPRNG